MKILYITIIIIIVICEIYLRYFDNIEKSNNITKSTNIKKSNNIKEYIYSNNIDNSNNIENSNNMGNSNNIENFLNKKNILVKEPWNKIKKINDNTIYYIKINKFDDENFIKWKNLTNKIDYDIDNKFLIIKTKSEPESQSNAHALAIANLYISCLNNEINIEDIVENKLIELSTKKAARNNLVYSKLVELIKEGIDKLNENDNNKLFINNFFDTTDMQIEDDDLINYNIKSDEKFITGSCKQNNMINIEKYSEENLDNNDSIQNKLNNSVLNSDIIQNKLNNSVLKSDIIQNKKKVIEAYGGNEYASIFT